MIEFKHFLLAIFLLNSIVVEGQVTASSRSHIYDALASQNLQKLEGALKGLEGKLDNDSDAYKGALMMKKAGFLKKPLDKLQLFKAGKELLESAITKDNENAEYRFLRLMIQENAPPILKYRSDIDNDVQVIKEAYKRISQEGQKSLKAYINDSKVLTSEDF